MIAEFAFGDYDVCFTLEKGLCSTTAETTPMD